MKDNDVTLISIIVPVFKVEQYLNKCLDSIINQTYTNLEIIIIDDGSPDECGKICDEYASIDKRIKVIHKKNAGIMSAWKDGFSLSTGQYITFADSDDWLELNMIEKMANAIGENIDLGISGYYINEAAAETVKPPTLLNCSGSLNEDELHNFKLRCLHNEKHQEGAIQFFKWNKIFKRSLIENNIKYCDNKISAYDDLCISFPSILDAKSIIIINEPLYHYRMNPDSVMHSNKNHFYSMLYAFENVSEIIKEKNCENLIDANYLLMHILDNCIRQALTTRNYKAVLKDMRNMIYNLEIKKFKKNLTKRKYHTLSLFFKRKFFLLKLIRTFYRLI